jgi:hypothetical protein
MDHPAAVRQGEQPGDAVLLTNRTPPDEFVQHIRLARQKSVESIIETGTLLIQAKAQAGRGEFEALVLSKLPFKPFTARRLMAVARKRSCPIGRMRRICRRPGARFTIYRASRIRRCGRQSQTARSPRRWSATRSRSCAACRPAKATAQPGHSRPRHPASLWISSFGRSRRPNGPGGRT